MHVHMYSPPPQQNDLFQRFTLSLKYIFEHLLKEQRHLCAQGRHEITDLASQQSNIPKH